MKPGEKKRNFFLRLNHQTRFLRVKNVVFFSPGNLGFEFLFDFLKKKINQKWSKS
jgi:hypothetical protein